MTCTFIIAGGKRECLVGEVEKMVAEGDTEVLEVVVVVTVEDVLLKGRVGESETDFRSGTVVWIGSISLKKIKKKNNNKLFCFEAVNIVCIVSPSSVISLLSNN
jgi:hypothetical protein